MTFFEYFANIAFAAKRFLCVLTLALTCGGNTICIAEQNGHSPEYLVEDTPVESWVKGQLLFGKVADLNIRCGVDQAKALSQNDTEWKQNCRRISSAFLEGLLKSNIATNQGVRLNGAWIVGEVSAEALHVSAPVWLDDSRFDDFVDIEGASFDRDLTFDSSRFRKGLNAERVFVGGSLYLRDGAKFFNNSFDLSDAQINKSFVMTNASFDSNADLILQGADVHGVVDLGGSKFQAGIAADRVRIGKAFLLRDGAEVGGRSLRLPAAILGSELDLSNLTIHSGILADDIIIKGRCLLNGVTSDEKADISINDGLINGDLQIIKSDIKSSFSGGRLNTKYNLLIKDSKFEGSSFNIIGSTVEGDFSIDNSSFADLSADRLRVDGQLLITSNSTFYAQSPSLKAARVGGDVEINAVDFQLPLQADRLNIGGALFILNLEHKWNSMEIQAPSIVVGSDLEIINSTLGNLDISNIEMKGNLRIIQSSKIDSLMMDGANLRGDLQLGGSEVDSLNASHIAAKDVFLLDARLGDRIDFKMSSVSGFFDISGSEMHVVDLTRTVIVGDLRVASEERPTPAWRDDSELILVGAHAAVLEDGKYQSGVDPWPKRLQLDGFSYDRFGTQHDVAWAEKWLDKQHRFSPQPYQQFANFFRNIGEPQNADNILYAARDKELVEYWETGHCEWGFGLIRLHNDCWRAAGIGSLKVLIGYGLGKGLFLALFWVLFFTILGSGILVFSEAARRLGFAWIIGASLNKLLPIVEINKEFTEFFHDPKRDNLRDWQLIYFGLHAIMGYVLASFVVAALAGLTQTK